MRITHRFFVVYILNFFVSVLGVGDGRCHGSWVFEDFEISLIKCDGCAFWLLRMECKAAVEKAIVHIIFFITSKINLNQTKRSEFSRINNCLKFAVKRHMIVCKF